jgi:hypothetical protein
MTMPAPDPFITLDAVTGFKPVDTGDPSKRAEAFAAAVERHLQRKIGFHPASVSTQNERTEGNGRSLLPLKRWPITACPQIIIEGTTYDVLGPASATDGGQLFTISSDGFFLQARRGGIFKDEASILVPSYTAGWDADGIEDLVLVGVMLVHLLLQEVSLIGQGAVTIGSQQIQTVVRNSKDYQFITETIDRYAWRPF